jgi:hypothetical protein
MKKQVLSIVILVVFFGLTSAASHKFHIALYKIDFVSEKKMIQITSRMHLEDLNQALEKKFKKKFAIEIEKNSIDEILLQQYILNRFSITVNNMHKTINFLSTEIDGDEIVCYWNIKNIIKVNTLEISNSVFTEVFEDQQNLVNVSAKGKIQSYLFTRSSTLKNFTL